jgi:hypothetical protein
MTSLRDSKGIFRLIVVVMGFFLLEIADILGIWKPNLIIQNYTKFIEWGNLHSFQ